MIYNKSNSLYLNNIKLNENYSNEDVTLSKIPILNESDLKYIEEYNSSMEIIAGNMFLEVSFRDVIDSIKKFIITAFRKFTDFMNKIISVFPINFSKNSTFVEKYKTEIIGGYQHLRANNEKFMGIAYRTRLINKYGNNISANTINSELNWIGGGAKEPIYVYGYVDTYNSIRSNVIKDILDSDSDYNYESAEEVENHIRKEIIPDGEVNLVEYYNSGEELCSFFRNKTGKEIRAEYKEVKEIVDKCLKNLDEAWDRLNKLNKETHSYDMENGRRIFNDLTTHITFVQTVCQRVTSLLAKTRYEELAQARKFAIECVNAYNRKKKEQG